MSCSIFQTDKRKERKDLKWKESLINNCETNKYNKSTFKINEVEQGNHVYYELDSIRIYISYDFVIGFHSNDKSESEIKYAEIKNNYGKLFSDGFVTGNMFACEFNKDCIFVKPEFKVKRDGQWIKKDLTLYGYSGPTIKILNVQEKKELSDNLSRVFEIWATSSKLESGWGSFAVIYIELTNENADLNTDLKTFLNGAKLNCFRYAYSQV